MTLTSEQRAEGWRENHPGRVWRCSIGPATGLPSGADAPMRRAVEAAYRSLTGTDAIACFSGWEDGFTTGETEYLAALADAVAPHEPAPADPHDDPATRWESGPDGDFTRVMLYDEKPAWLRDDDLIRFERGNGWLRADEWYSLAWVWSECPAFFLRRRPQVDEELCSTIWDALAGPRDWGVTREQAEAVARALMADGWRKEGGE